MSREHLSVPLPDGWDEWPPERQRAYAQTVQIAINEVMDDMIMTGELEATSKLVDVKIVLDTEES